MFFKFSLKGMLTQYSTIILCLLLLLNVSGSVRECWHCYSERDGNCQNPYQGRFRPNSTILKPDCTYDMARAFHATVIYVLSTMSQIEDIGANDTSKWADLDLIPMKFECCKTEMDVITYEGESKSLVIRGCCANPAIYDQCAEVGTLCQEVTETLEGPNGTVNHSTCKLDHCSRCQNDDCNTAILMKSARPLIVITGIIICLGFVGKFEINLFPNT